MREIPRDILLEYYKKLKGSLFKIIPLYEGRDFKTRKVTLVPEAAFNSYKNYTSNLLVELHGNSSLFFVSAYSIKVFNIIRGMLLEVEMDEHERVKSCVMECINLCDKIMEEVRSDV